MNVGIDLGTTYSLIAKVTADGTPTLLPDHIRHDVFHTPSAVTIAENGAFVGHLVDTLAEHDPDVTTIRFFKRHFGEGKPIHIDESGISWYAETVAALVLRKLCADAESHTSSRVDGAVITVPAHSNGIQRQAVLAAASLAEIRVLGLLEEPVAAALHYGFATSSNDQVLLVYDFGGGTFDVTVLSMDQKGVYVLAKDGVTTLGGKEFDEKIGEMVLEQFARADASPTLNARSLLQLRRVSEELKLELCMPKPRVRRVVLLGGHSVEVNITRADFEAGIAAAIDQTEEVTRRCLEGAGLKPKDVHALLLVGGSSMVPCIAQRMRSVFGAPGQRVLFHEPMKAVAYGAAVHTLQLTGEATQYQLPPELHGVTGYAVGVRTVNPTNGRVMIDTIIKKNMPLPIRVKKTYYTSRPDQERVVLELVQFRNGTEPAVSLGRLVVGPLPSPQQNYPIEVSVENGEDGTVAVQAYDPQTGIELAQVFSRETDDVFGHLAAQRALVRSTLINNL